MQHASGSVSRQSLIQPKLARVVGTRETAIGAPLSQTFDECQAEEKKRLVFFKGALQSVRSSLDLTANDKCVRARSVWLDSGRVRWAAAAARFPSRSIIVQ